MPIKKENRHLYPREWPAIRQRILARAGNKCEKCGVANGAYGARDKYGEWHNDKDIHGMNCGYGENLFNGGLPDMITIVLTIAHLDHNPANCDDDNLRAYCQRCHLHYDRPHHINTARRTRALKSKQYSFLHNLQSNEEMSMYEHRVFSAMRQRGVEISLRSANSNTSFVDDVRFYKYVHWLKIAAEGGMNSDMLKRVLDADCIGYMFAQTDLAIPLFGGDDIHVSATPQMAAAALNAHIDTAAKIDKMKKSFGAYQHD